MEKNSSIYNNKRFAQLSDSYGDYERNVNLPEPAARRDTYGAGHRQATQSAARRRLRPAR